MRIEAWQKFQVVDVPKLKRNKCFCHSFFLIIGDTIWVSWAVMTFNIRQSSRYRKVWVHFTYSSLTTVKFRSPIDSHENYRLCLFVYEKMHHPKNETAFHLSKPALFYVSTFFFDLSLDELSELCKRGLIWHWIVPSTTHKFVSNRIYTVFVGSLAIMRQYSSINL